MQELLTGRRRLPGFDGEWEIRRLGDIVEKLVNGGTPSTQQPEYWAGHIPWITGADILDQQVSEIRRYITEEAVRNSSTNVVERDNLLLVSRTGVGKLAIAPFAVAISQDFTGVYVRPDRMLPEFLFRFLDYKPEVLRSQNQGTSIQGITRETLISIPVPVPQLAEQTAIVAILSDMDAEIAVLERRRDKTKLLKQGMMQELLTGKTRLK
jgi:type I restriction enzyme S subunit